MRWSTIFIAGCVAVSATALGTAAYLALGLTGTQATAAMLGVLAVFAALGFSARRKRETEATPRQVADLSRGTAELARQVGEFGRRLAAVEGAFAKQDERLASIAEQKAQAETASLASEIEVLGTLVKQLADSVAAHEVTLLSTLARGNTGPGISTSQPAPAQPAASPPAVEAPPVRVAPAVDPERLRQVRAALEANRIDLYLQPIVTLPQRKVRYYEAVTRLRTEDGSVLLPADYLATAEIGGLLPMLDNLMLFRCVQVVRRMSAKNRELGLFCNIAPATLLDAEFFPQFQEFLADNRSLASSLVFELPQEGLRAIGPIERASLGQLAASGFRFSMDRVVDLQIDARSLAEEGFRYVKVPAALLLDHEAAGAVNIHASDLSNLLGRYGIELIAERIESEATVVDLLDYDVRFGQGFLFAPPRPVRSEVFQSASDRTGATLPAAPTMPGAAATRPAQGAGAAGLRLREAPAPREAAAEQVPGERIPPGLLQLARNAAARRA